MKGINRAIVIAIGLIAIINCSMGQQINLLLSKTSTQTNAIEIKTKTLIMTEKELMTITLTNILTNTIAKKYAMTGSTIVGEWERHGKQDGKPYTEHLIFLEDGSYSIKAIFDNSKETMTSNSGTYTFDDNIITYIDKNSKVVTEKYHLELNGNKLVINNNAALAWTRVSK
jgi:hypothetical protein